MCGIAGIVSGSDLNRKIRENNVRIGISAQVHRGPDEQSYFEDELITLGVCRLSIVDVSGGQQPSFNQDRSIVSIFNGEIYNHGEIISLLKKKGVKLSSHGDSECIPHLYEIFGPEFVHFLRGMFAIAIWDSQRGILVLARDRIGEKPLWLSNFDNKLFFASEIKTLFAMGVTPEIDPIRIPEYLQFGFVNAPNSSYRNITELSPGTIMQYNIHSQDSIVTQYWKPEIKGDNENNICGYDEKLEFLLRDSVKSSLRVERSIGSFLSGGIDSSLITAIASQEFGPKFPTFSLGFKNHDYDESLHAKKISNYLGTDHHEVMIDDNLPMLLENVIKTVDLPFADSSILPTYALSRFTREKVVVALGGDGGDEVFGGYERYQVNLILEKADFLIKSLPKTTLRRIEYRDSRISKFLSLLKYKSSDSRYSQLRSLMEKSQLESLLVNSLSSLIDEFYSEYSFSENSDLLAQMQIEDMKSYLPGDLMRKTDLASMAHGLEVRSPFLDHRIVEFGLNLAAKDKLKFRKGKLPLRRILDRYIPQSLTNRPKMGFGVPMSMWLRKDLNQVVSENLLSGSPQVEQWINLANLRVCIDKHNSGKNYSNVIWPVLVLELVLRKWS